MNEKTRIPAREKMMRTKRGSTLLATLLLVVALSGLVVVSHGDMSDSNRSNRGRDNYASSQAASEYGVELAISQLASGMRYTIDGDANSQVLGDWVSGVDGENLFAISGSDVAPDQRRIGGVYNGQEFRVQVRSARLAYANDPDGNIIHSGWLRDPGAHKPNIEAGEGYEFTDVYEITSTARHSSGQTVANSPLTQTAVRTVVEFNHRNVMNDLVTRAGALHNEKPSYFQPEGGQNSGYYNTGHPFDDDGTRESNFNLKISGEDHYLTKYFVEDVVSNTIVTPLKLFTNEANYFGAKGGYWSNGCLTLNYQLDPELCNPYRPTTRKFGTGVNQEMKVKHPELGLAKADTYLLGGKENRTVSFKTDASGDNIIGANGLEVIKETSSGQANEGGNFNVVLGEFEHLMNLYINMAGITPSNAYPNDGAFADTSQWFQMYIGQYTDDPQSSTCDSSSLPLYHQTRIRAQTLHVIKNKKEQVLVREFKKGNKLTPVATGGKWTGNYMWIKAELESPGVFKIKEGSNKNAVCTPRVFMWQELVGYSLAKRPNGQPALRTDGTKRTYFRLDSEGQRIPVGFDEEFQKNGTNVNKYVQDRWDSLKVYEEVEGKPGVYEYVTKNTINDFLFEKDFGNDANGEPVKRKALAVFIGYEDQREHQADYNYTDMMFTIYVAPGSKEGVTNQAILDKVSDQWWERDEEEGLTGKFSHTALSTNADPSTKIYESAEDILKENFKLLNHNPKELFEEAIYTMVDTTDSAITKFPRAVFEKDSDGHSTGRLEPQLKKDYEDLGIHTFYYSQSDLVSYVQKDPLEFWDEGTKELDYVAILDEIKGLNPGITFLDVSERWDDASLDKVELTDTLPSSYKVASKEVSLRRIAGELIGFEMQEVPTIKTGDYAPLTNGDLDGSSDSTYPAPQQTILGFLPGEHKQSTLDIDKDKLANAGFIGIRDAMFPQPDGTETPFREFYGPTPDDAVALCYNDYYATDPDTKAEVQGMYGLKEERYSIGFHRSGKDDAYAAKHLQDHYEVVSLGVAGFNPYREASIGSGDKVVANERVVPNSNDAFAITMKYAVDEDPAPTFVFDKPIDGAGVMVVNGNLLITDNFAYHGTLIVLGDVIIRPTLKVDQWVWNGDGWPEGPNGEPMRLDPDYGTWGYIWVNPSDANDKRFTHYILDDNGNPILDAQGNKKTMCCPREESYYRGKLTVQGELLVKGRVITEKALDTIRGGDVYGELTVYWSLDAVRDTAGEIATGSSSANRLSWSHDDNIPVDHLWQDKKDW